MTPEQIQTVQKSWSSVLPIQDQAGALFYAKLFEIDPELQALFKGDMVEQGRKLMSMIGVAVNALDRLETVVPAVQAMGERHADYGVKEADYAAVGSALLWALETGLGEAFIPQVEQAWTEVYGVLATTMKDAARAATAA